MSPRCPRCHYRRGPQEPTRRSWSLIRTKPLKTPPQRPSKHYRDITETIWLLLKTTLPSQSKRSVASQEPNQSNIHTHRIFDVEVAAAGLRTWGYFERNDVSVSLLLAYVRTDSVPKRMSYIFPYMDVSKCEKRLDTSIYGKSLWHHFRDGVST